MAINRKIVLITDYVHSVLLDGLHQNGYRVDYQPNISYEEVFRIINKYQGIVINSKIKMTEELMQLAPKLEFVARLGSGLEIIDLEAAKARHIHVFSAPDGNRVAVAEHAIGMLLVLINQLFKSHAMVFSGKKWDREACRGWEIEGKTVGVIGFGNNGSAFAERLQGFNCKILAYDKYKRNYAQHLSYVEELTAVDRILSESDIISLHLPLTAETHHYVDSIFLNRCKKNIILLNTSRGKIVETKALISGLHSGKIRGAGLDVFENEHPEQFTVQEKTLYDELYKMDQVVLSPHVAGWTQESLEKIANSLLMKILNLSSVL